MPVDNVPPVRQPGHILRFRHRTSEELGRTDDSSAGNGDLDRYHRGAEPDDYRHRMVTNVLAFIFVLALIAGGLWLADSMARLRKNEDCALAGRRDCAPAEVNRSRW